MPQTPTKKNQWLSAWHTSCSYLKRITGSVDHGTIGERIRKMRPKLRIAAFLSVVGLISIAPQAQAALCVDGGTYASYQLAGSCTVGDKTFSNFTYTSSASPGVT